MTTKPTTIRIDVNTLNQIDQKCISLKCTRNDYIKYAIDSLLKDSPEFNYNKLESETTEVTKTPKIIVTRYSPDGKTWIDLTQK